MKKNKINCVPYILRRRCNSDKIVIKNDINKCNDLLISNKDQYKKELGFLETILFNEISSLPPSKVHHAIKLKRKVLNGKLDELKEKELNLFFSKHAIFIIKKCELYKRQIDILSQKKFILFANFKNNSIRQLKDKCLSNNAFLNGVCTSLDSSAIYNIKRFLNDEKLSTKKKKNIEKTLQNYFNRMVMKPTPFSTFVETEILCVNKCTKIHSNFSFSKCVLNEKIFDFIQNSIISDYNYRSFFYLRVNPTLLDLSYKYIFLTTVIKKGLNDYYSEKFITIKKSNLVALIIDHIKKSNTSKLIEIEKELYTLHSSIFLNSSQIEYIIFKLVSVGLLEIDLNISQMDYHYIDKFISMFSKIGSKNLNIISYLINIRKNINNINKTNLSAFEKMNEKIVIQSNLKKLVKSLLPKEDNELLQNLTNYKDLLYENNTCKQVNNYKHISNYETFSMIEKIYRLFDNSFITKIRYRNLFIKLYGKRGKTELINFFRNYVEFQKKQDQDVDLLISSDKDIATLSQLRIEFLNYLKENINEQNNIDINKEFMESIIQRFPKLLKSKTQYGIYFQEVSDKKIINNVSPGLMRHFSRYIADIEKEDRESIINNFLNYLKKNNNGIIYSDIGTTLFNNINKHKQILDSSIKYPKSYVKSNIDLNKLYIVYDKDINAIRIVDSKNDFIEPTPMGFQFHRTSPKFYSFLSMFSNSQGVELSIWDRFHSFFHNKISNSYIFHYPRITMDNNFIVERETWKINIDLLKKICDQNKNEVDIYLGLYNLFYKNRIPISYFARVMSDIDGIIDVSKINLKYWANLAFNNKYRKPQYYCLNNYLDYLNFCSIIKNMSSSNILTIQESLPEYGQIVEEFLVNFSEVL